jgi:hypothetical protein
LAGGMLVMPKISMVDDEARLRRWDRHPRVTSFSAKHQDACGADACARSR